MPDERHNAPAGGPSRPAEISPPPTTGTPLDPTSPFPPKYRRKIRTQRLIVVLLIAFGLVLGLVLIMRAVFRRPALSPSPTATVTVTATPTPFAERDTDGDGLTDQEEVTAGTDLNKADSDGDGYTDKQELDAGFDPLGPGALDRDSDGLPDREEGVVGSDPRNADTDGDGYLDGVEVRNCYNPRIPSPGDKVGGCPPYPGL